MSLKKIHAEVLSDSDEDTQKDNFKDDNIDYK